MAARPPSNSQLSGDFAVYGVRSTAARDSVSRRLANLATKLGVEGLSKTRTLLINLTKAEIERGSGDVHKNINI